MDISLVSMILALVYLLILVVLSDDKAPEVYLLKVIITTVLVILTIIAGNYLAALIWGMCLYINVSALFDEL